MATYDRSRDALDARIVYDGSATAGKTTNLSELRRFVTVARRSELRVSPSAAGRTLYFDWLRLDGGRVLGRALSCHLLTVPGQSALLRRRQHILRGADAIVFVVEATPDGVESVKALWPEALEMARALAVEGKLPLVVQANKQDLPGALTPDQVRVALGVPESVLVVESTAIAGLGVRETLALVIRALVDTLRPKILAGELVNFPSEVEDTDVLQRALEALDVPIGDAQLVAELEAAAKRLDEHDNSYGGPLPPLPIAPVANLVWPDHEAARTSLWQLGHHPVVPRRDLIGSRGRADGSGTSDLLVLEVGGVCLKTSPRWLFDELDEARSKFEELIARKRDLGAFLAGGTMVVVAADGEASRLWTVAPWLPTLGGLMARAAEDRNEAQLASCLIGWAEAATRGAQLAARDGVALDLHPANLALERGRVVYIDDDIGRSSRLPALGYALLRRVEEYRAFPRAVEIYVGALEEYLPALLTRADVEKIGLRDVVFAAQAREADVLAAKSRLERVLWRVAG